MERDIIKAIEAEKEYIDNKISGNTVESLLTYITKYGYANLSDFRKDKLLYNIKSLNIQSVNISSDQIEYEGNTIFIDYFKQHIPYILWNIDLNHNMAYLPLSATKKFKRFVTIHPGYDCESTKGNIFSFNQDLDVIIIVPNIYIDLNKYLMAAISNYLQSFTEKTVKVDGNDILIDNKKVLGYAVASDNEYCVSMYHISFTDNDELIKKLCPQSKKTPGHIDFIDAKKICDFIVEWLQ